MLRCWRYLIFRMNYIHKIKKRETALALLAAVFLCFFFAYFLVGVKFSPTPVAYEDLGADSLSGFVVFNPISYQSEVGALVLSFADGTEKFLSGDWDVFSIAPDKAVLFGANGPDEDGNLAVGVVSGETIYTSVLGGVTGDIVDVQCNDDCSYIYVQMEGFPITYFCITSFTDGVLGRCGHLTSTVGTVATWNKDNKEEMIFFDNQGYLYLRDYVTAQLFTITEEDENYEVYKDMLWPDKEYLLGKSFGFVSEDDAPLLKAPAFSDVYSLRDSNFYLVDGVNSLSLVNLEDFIESTLYEGGIDDANIYFYEKFH